MARLVELPQVAAVEGGEQRSVWLNPEHVVYVTPSHVGSWVSTPMGERFHVDLPPFEVVDRLHLVYRIDLAEPDKALVKGNLNR